MKGTLSAHGKSLNRQKVSAKIVYDLVSRTARLTNTFSRNLINFIFLKMRECYLKLYIRKQTRVARIIKGVKGKELRKDPNNSE